MDARSPSTPLSPYTLANDRYKTNINRNKTRKWVEAKKIDYGGDDWGADDDFYDDDDGGDNNGSPVEQNPPPALLQPATRPGRLAGLRSIGQDDGSGGANTTPRSGSAGSARSLRPSERLALEKQRRAQRSVTGPPILHIETELQSPQQQPLQQVQQQQPQVESAVSTGTLSTNQSPFPERSSSMVSRDEPNLTVESAVSQPPKESSRSTSPATASRSQSPTPPVVASWAPAKVIRPSDIYKRAGSEDEKRETGTPSSATGPRPGLVSFGSSSGSTGPTHPFAAGGASAPAAAGGDLTAAQPDAPSPAAQKPAAETPATRTETRPDAEASLSSQPHPPPENTLQPPSRRFSTSPKLPEFHSLSDFGNDLFGSGDKFDSSLASTSQPDAPASMPPTTTTTTAATAATARGPAAESMPTSMPVKLNSGRNVAQQIAALDQRQPKPLRPSIPGGWVSETTTVPSEGATPFEEPAKSGTLGMNFNPKDVSSITERSEDLSLKPAPLRTPTPRSISPVKSDSGRGPSRASHTSSTMDYSAAPLRNIPSPLANNGEQPTADAEKDESKNSKSEGADTEMHQHNEPQSTSVAPAPLQPRKGGPSAEFLAADLRPPAIRAPTSGTTGTVDSSSPLKESDVLRDEIIRRLSPVRSSDAQLDAAARDESATRESAYLSDVYGDYWTSADDEQEGKRGGEQMQPLDATHSNEVGKNATSATPTPPASEGPYTFVNQRTAASAAPNQTRSAILTSEPEPVRAAPAPQQQQQQQRYSWEAAPPVEAKKPTASLTRPPHAVHSLSHDSSSNLSGDIPQLSPISSGPMSPLISLPILNFSMNEWDKNAKEDLNVPGKNASTDDAHHGPIPVESEAAEVPSSPTREPQTPGEQQHQDAEGSRNNRASLIFTPSDEKIVVLNSPFSPMSLASDLDGAPATDRRARNGPESPTTSDPAPPTDIPLPRSPSPTPQGTTSASAAATASTTNKLSPSQEHIMGLKQIMALPTSPERVYKMLEARTEFSTTPSGLMDWLAAMVARPEHELAGSGFRYPSMGVDGPLLANTGGNAGRGRSGTLDAGGSFAGGAAGGQLSYSGSLNMGSGNGGGGGLGGGLGASVGSVRIPGASAAQLQLGNLMHGQAGTKGKELLHSAGKMGKGLLSKGKNKLRERKG